MRMRRLVSLLVLLCFSVYPAWAQEAPRSFAGLAQKLLPTVVNVSSTAQGQSPEGVLTPPIPQQDVQPGSPFEDFYENYMDRQQGGPLTEAASLGSGFILDAAKGLIITNNHVIKDASDIRITLHDETTYKASVVGVDDKTDIALLQIDPKGAALQQVAFGDSDDLHVGDWILAIGNPFGLGGTVTAGIVSARSRDINAGPYDDFIQTDASINRGNSGGPMFNMKGELIGINTAIFSPSGGSVGIGFAIPINMSRPIISQLVAYGETRRGWLGVKIQSVTPEIAESLGLQGRQRGALIADVTKGGPAEKAGFKPYDILLSFNGRPVRTMRDLPRLVAEAEVDQAIPIELFREGQSVNVTATMGALEVAEEKGMIEEEGLLTPSIPQEEETTPEPGQPATPKAKTSSPALRFNALALTIAPITKELTDQFGLVEGMTGLVITKVGDYSDAARKGLLPGDIILEVNREKIGTLQDLEALLIAAAKEKRGSVLMLIDRAGDERFVALKLASKKDAAPKQ